MGSKQPRQLAAMVLTFTHHSLLITQKSVSIQPHFTGQVMGNAWKNQDLGGGGLQNANLRLAALLKKRRTAWLLLFAFPVGLHHDYLADPRGAWSIRITALLAAGALWYGVASAAIALGAVLLVWTLIDIRWVEQRVVALNKQLRMQVYLGQTAGAPAGFKGRYTDDERPTAEPPSGTGRALSFTEQERLLREHARKPDLPQ
jgi:hypothetical protein